MPPPRPQHRRFRAISPNSLAWRAIHRAHGTSTASGSSFRAAANAASSSDSALATTAAADSPSSVRTIAPGRTRRFTRLTRPERNTAGCFCRFRSRSVAPLSPSVTENPDSVAITGSSLAMVAANTGSPPGAQCRPLRLARRRPRPVPDHRVPPPRHRGRHRRSISRKPPSTPGRLAAPPRCAPAGARGPRASV